MPFGSAVEGGGLEVRRERNDVAQVLGRRHDIDPLVVGDCHEVALDEVAAGSVHRIPVCLEGGIEVGRLVGLDPVDDGHLVGVGVDLAGGRCPSRTFLLEALPAEREDRVRVEAIERAQADHLVVLLAPDRPVVGPLGEGALEPGRIQLDGDLGRLARPLEAALLGGRQYVHAGRDEFVEEGRQLARGLDLDPLPEPDLRDSRPGLRFLEVRGDRLETTGDRIQSLGERRVVAGEQQEEAVADMIECERTTLPEAEDVGVEDGPADVVELELALESGLVGERRRVDRLDRAEVLAIRRQLGEDSLAGSRRRAGRRPGGARAPCPRTGLSRMRRTNRVSTRS